MVWSDPGCKCEGAWTRISRRNPRAARVAFGALAAGAALLLAACSSSSSQLQPPQQLAGQRGDQRERGREFGGSVRRGRLRAPGRRQQVRGDAELQRLRPQLRRQDPQHREPGREEDHDHPGRQRAGRVRGDRAGRLGHRQGLGHGADDLQQPGLDRPSTTPRSRTRSTRDTRRSSWGARWTRRQTRPRSPRPRRPASWWASTAEPRTWTSGAKTTYNTDDPYALDAKLATEQAIAQHNGQPFNAIAITSTATGPATAIEEDAIQAELAKDCPKCTLTAVNVEVPQWQTQIASTVTSAAAAAPRT